MNTRRSSLKRKVVVILIIQKWLLMFIIISPFEFFENWLVFEMFPFDSWLSSVCYLIDTHLQQEKISWSILPIKFTTDLSRLLASMNDQLKILCAILELSILIRCPNQFSSFDWIIFIKILHRPNSKLLIFKKCTLPIASSHDIHKFNTEFDLKFKNILLHGYNE